MTVAFKRRIRDLLPKLLADALIVLGMLQSAGAITAGAFQSLPNRLYHFLIFIQMYSHGNTPFYFYHTIRTAVPQPDILQNVYTEADVPPVVIAI